MLVEHRSPCLPHFLVYGFGVGDPSFGVGVRDSGSDVPLAVPEVLVKVAQARRTFRIDSLCVSPMPLSPSLCVAVLGRRNESIHYAVQDVCAKGV